MSSPQTAKRQGIRILYHLLFWVVSFTVFLQLTKSGERTERIDYIYTLLFQLSILPAVYLNLEWLLPFATRSKKWWRYFAGLAAILLLFPFLNYRFFQEWSAQLLPDYFFISYFSFWEVAFYFSVYLFITSLLKLSRSWFEVNALRKQLLEAEKQKVQMELKALRSQINPHFLFNTLNNIYSLSLDMDNRLPGAVLQLSEIMRYYLYESGEDEVLLEKELRILEDYIYLQRIRSDEKLDFRIKIEGDPKDKRIAPLLVLTFVENAFKHGAKGKTGAAFIHLQITIEENKFHFHIRNNYGQADTTVPENFQGLGLENVRRRLELLYPGRHSFHILSDNQEFSVNLDLQL
jgi:sensor histidine kinase YesM